MDYQVKLDAFQGPLDLLLYLVKRDEVDLRDIPIAKLTGQYLDYLNVMRIIDVENAGDFLVMAATLMEIKSRVLLPQRETGEAEEEDDPRQELVRQLIEYKRFKEAAQRLEEQAEQQSQRIARTPPPDPTRPAETPLRPVELWDLVSAFGRLLRETMALQPQEITFDQTPIDQYMDGIAEQLQARGPLPLSDLFTPPRTRSRLVGLFLAMLELIRGRRLWIEQPEDYGDIVLTLKTQAEA